MISSGVLSGRVSKSVRSCFDGADAYLDFEVELRKVMKRNGVVSSSVEVIVVVKAERDGGD